MPAIWKYRRIPGEILAASFEVQLFGPAMLLSTLVIIDKVLMYKSVSTLPQFVVGGELRPIQAGMTAGGHRDGSAQSNRVLYVAGREVSGRGIESQMSNIRKLRMSVLAVISCIRDEYPDPTAPIVMELNRFRQMQNGDYSLINFRKKA